MLTFQELRERLQAVINNPATTPEEADRVLRKVGAQGARAYQVKFKDGVDGFTVDIMPTLSIAPNCP